MKSVMHKGGRLTALVLSACVLLACGGGSGGGGGGTDLVDPPVDGGTVYRVKGAVSGTIAPVAISDGFETLPVTADGGFAFTHGYKKGDTFSITVDTANSDQLCTLTHGSGLVLGDVNDVAIDCLELREADVRVVKPDYYTAFSQLDLRSTYQKQGLTAATATLVVAKNQFVSLLGSNAQARPVYLAFVASFTDIVVDSTSTAVALVLLNPSIHNAIEERGGDFAAFATRFANLEAVTSLAQALKDAADAGQLDLSAPKNGTLVLLDAAVAAAAADVIAVDNAASAKTVAHKLNVMPVSGSAAGVDFALNRLAAADEQGNNYQLTVTNNVQRHVAVESEILAQAITLSPQAHQQLNIASNNISSVLWNVYGPGAQAATVPVSSLLKQAVVDSAIEFYSLPSLAFETGRLAGLDQRLLGCAGAEPLQQVYDGISTQLLADSNFEQALKVPQYTAAYDAVTQPLRGEIITQLDALMSCELFRKGRWLDDHVDTAAAQLAVVLGIVQAHYPSRVAGENVLVHEGLLAAGEVINNNLTQQQWRLSNQLAIQIVRVNGSTTTPVTGTVAINEGESVSLHANCIDPTNQQAVDCDVAWQASSGTSAGNGFDHTYSDSGSFAIIVTATDADGAAASVNVNINARELAPNGRLRNFAGTLISSSYIHNFGDVPVNTVVEAVFALSNEGDDVLYVDSAQVAAPFAVTSVSDSTLAPGESAQITVRFAPTQTQASNAQLTLPLHGNEPQDARTLQFNLRGNGIASGDTPLVNSYWLQRDGDMTYQYNVKSADIVTDASDNILQFRAFMDISTLYPQISVALANFNGAGSYALDDLDSGRSCLGFLAYAQPTSQWWCTRTAAPFDAQRSTGTATYLEGEAGQQIVEFDFDVVPASCVALPCTTQHVSGRFEVQ